MNGTELIQVERQRQMDAEGWSIEHDDGHVNGALVRAAIVYASVESNAGEQTGLWPWGGGYKPSTDPIRNLVKAGALIAAEIDRLQRQAEIRSGSDV